MDFAGRNRMDRLLHGHGSFERASLSALIYYRYVKQRTGPSLNITTIYSKGRLNVAFYTAHSVHMRLWLYILYIPHN